MAETKKTSLSAGLAVYAVLKEALKDKVTKVYPVVATEDAVMPFLVYRRTGVRSNPSKVGTCFDSSVIELSVFSTDYGEGVEIMEAARSTLENKTIHCTKAKDGFDMVVGCTQMTDCEESWDGDCYRQDLTIECKI